MCKYVWCISVSDEEHAIASLQPVRANTHVTLFGNEDALHPEILCIVPHHVDISPVLEVFHSINGRFVDIESSSSISSSSCKGSGRCSRRERLAFDAFRFSRFSGHSASGWLFLNSVSAVYAVSEWSMIDNTGTFAPTKGNHSGNRYWFSSCFSFCFFFGFSFCYSF
jgi:hypothetical protein